MLCLVRETAAATKVWPCLKSARVCAAHPSTCPPVQVHAAQPRGEWDRQAFAQLLRLCMDLPLARFDPQVRRLENASPEPLKTQMETGWNGVP